MKFLVVFAAVMAVSQAASLFESDLIDWIVFKQKHGKRYDNEDEERLRMGIFMDNARQIEEHNARYAMGLVRYKVSVNEWADMEHGEFVRVMNGFNKSGLVRPAVSRGASFIAALNADIPDSIDWRTKGAVTPVKNQGQCGSCWSFSATGSLEGQHFRKTGKLISLSEQNILDCSRSYGTNGCGGGWMDLAFKYVKDNDGLDTEKSYPYLAEDEYTCNYNAKNSGAEDTGFVDIPGGDEDKLQQAVATVGPVSVAMDAGHSSFQFYNGGVYYEPDCSSEMLDHGVLVVGYGNEDGQDYWLVKNSWGTSWGESGYFKLARNQDNHCGVASKASYPLV